MTEPPAEPERGQPLRTLRTTAFARGPRGGNQAAVVLGGAQLADGEMQRLAADQGIETVFVLAPRDPAAALALRYFVPNHEMSMCVHGTVGALAALSETGLLAPGTVSIETSLGGTRARVERAGRGAKVGVEMPAPAFGCRLTAVDELASVLGVPTAALESAELPAQVASVARSKLMVPLRDAEALDRLRPDWPALWRFCEELAVTGIYAFTRRTRSSAWDIDARQFPVRAGFPEDAATGVAAAALAGYLIAHSVLGETRGEERRFRIAQGDAMGAPSLLEVQARLREGVVVSTEVWGTGSIDPAPPI
jgi:trans-2,3-dihydro-3-hydroxyanthranilate isomerase